MLTLITTFFFFLQYNITSMSDKVDPKALKQPKDIVAQDRNWTIRVNNEL